MKKFTILSLMLWHIFAFAIHGSLMTNQEEAQAIAENSSTKEAIQNAYSNYMGYLNQYRDGSLIYEVLCMAYQKETMALFDNIMQAIQNDTTGTIAPIASDYDEAHQKDYSSHLKMLIGMAQNILKIPAYGCFVPPSPEYSNLLSNGDFSQGISGWAITSGNAKLVVNPAGTIDPSSPVANLDSLTFTEVPTHPGYASVSQTIQTTPGNTYLISGYVLGTPPVDTGAYSGGIDVSNAKFLKSTITGKTTLFPQVSNEIDTGGLHRIYYWLIADGNSMTVSLSGGENASFKAIRVTDITSDVNNVMNIANLVCPPVTTLGDPGAGHYPQLEHRLTAGENLIDGNVSFQLNIDQSPLKNAGHPYWYIDGHNPANLGIKFVNDTNGAHAIDMPSQASITTNGPLPCPSGNYTISMDVYVPKGYGKVNIQAGGARLTDKFSLPKISQDFEGLQEGEWSSISMDADFSTGGFFRPTVTISNLGDSVVIACPTLTPSDSSTWDTINTFNPYNTSRTWSQKTGTKQSYDFTQSPISHDWGIALTGNTMFAPGSPACNFTMQTEEGIKLISTYDAEASPPYANGGIQSTQMIPGGCPFSIAMTFSGTPDSSGYQPTLALWTYGESQRGPNHPLTHTNAPCADPITEFDCEMGSDTAPKTPPPSGKVCVRDGSYIGHAFGGHSEYIDTNADGTEAWKVVPDFWDEAPHTLEMQGTYQSDGRLILIRLLDGVQFSIQDLEKGPFSPMYIKIATENPTWNSRGHIKGQAEVVIHQIDVEILPQFGLSLPVDFVDYTWFTPGGGGGISYCPFSD